MIFSILESTTKGGRAHAQAGPGREGVGKQDLILGTSIPGLDSSDLGTQICANFGGTALHSPYQGHCVLPEYFPLSLASMVAPLSPELDMEQA